MRGRERPCERPCEAVRERPCSLLIGSDRSHDPNSASHGLSRERPCSLLIGSDRSHDKLCEAEAVRP